MAAVEVVSRERVGSGTPVERLVCHPRLPLVACLDSARPAVHLWDCGGRRLHALATVGAGSTAYDDASYRDRMRRTPAVAWHPDQPLLVVAGEGGVARWTPTGLSGVEGIPPTASSYRSLAFSPDGRKLWASPSSGDGHDAWQHSDILDLTSGTIDVGPGWDTGVATHPAGGLVATLISNQGATIGLFARVDDKSAPAVMRVLRRALILDADGYETPVFSVDGRHLAIRGNAYENTLEVFGFPSLQRVLATTLGEPTPGYPYPQEWLEQMRAWSRHNIAFGVQPGVLWIGTPTGSLVEVDLDGQRAVEHDVLTGAPVTGLGTTPTGELVVASGEGELVLVSVLSGSAKTRATNDNAARAALTAFLDSTCEVPDNGDLEAHLVMTDGARTWESDDLATVTTAAPTDPTWLQLQAAINTRGQDEEPREPATGSDSTSNPGRTS